MNSIARAMTGAVALAALASSTGSLFAATVMPTHYNMSNGYTGSYTYFDDTYNGSGSTTTAGASLLNGLGDLTDGVIATQSWTITEAPDGAGPYVGWSIEPTISFYFAANTRLASFTMYLDDSDTGGVALPSSVEIWVNDGLYSASKTIVDPDADSGPEAITVTLPEWLATSHFVSQLDVTLRRSSASTPWIFLSEVTFDSVSAPPASAVPTPAAAAGGLMLLGGLLSKRRRD